MTPTNELRFVERIVYDEVNDYNGRVVIVLQQKWVEAGFLADRIADRTWVEKEEWRDVPVVKEEA